MRYLRLGPGARVALVAPSGPLRGEEDLSRALANARSLGWEPVVGDHVLERRGYFAGSDAARLADFNRALTDDTIDGIWCVRGGYGAMRILDGLDLSVFSRRPRVLIGYSDITALHCAVASTHDLVTFHGPTARAVISDFSRKSLRRAVIDGADPCGTAPAAHTLSSGRAHGRLAGGNLALLASLVGTPWAPRFDGCIVVLEDINEAVYRVDRMLQQLRLSGIFRGCRGIAFGHCTNCDEATDDGSRTLDDVLAETANWLGVPCVSGFPVGHIDDQWTIPLGASATLDADACVLAVDAPSFTT